MLSLERANLIHETYPTTIGRKKFGEYTLFDYYYKDYKLFYSVPGIRDLRGVVFNSEGEIASLPFHAFFNTYETAADLSYDGYYSEKQDGSMLQLSSDRGRLISGSRASLSGYVAREAPVSAELEEFVHAHPRYTFLFEFLDPQQPIVLPHEKKELVFLAARNKDTGEYSHNFNPPGTRHNQIYDLCRKEWPYLKQSLMEDTGREGVVMWTDGDFWKYKIPWYVSLHTLTTSTTPSDYLESWAQDTLDDSIATLMEYGRADLVKQIMDEVNNFTEKLNETLVYMVGEAQGKETAKDIALSIPRGTPVEEWAFAEVMKAFRGGYLDDIGRIFVNVKRRLDKHKFKKYFREEE